MVNMKLDRRTAMLLVGGAAVGGLAPAWAQEALTADMLVGVWRGVVSVGGTEIGGEVLFQPNGTFRRTNWWNGLMTWASGPFTIAGNRVHFEVDAYGPEIYLNQPMPRPPSETWMVDFFDGRMIEGRIGDSAAIRFERIG